MVIKKIFNILTVFILVITILCFSNTTSLVNAESSKNSTYNFVWNRGPRLQFKISDPNKFIVFVVDNNGISLLKIEKYQDQTYKDITSKLYIAKDKTYFEIPEKYIGNGLKIKVKAADDTNNYSINVFTIYKSNDSTAKKYFTANLAPRVSFVSIPSVDEDRMTDFIFKATDNDKIKSVVLTDLNTDKDVKVETTEYKGKAYLSCKLDSLKDKNSVYKIRIKIEDSSNSITTEQIQFSRKKGTKETPTYIAHRGASSLKKGNTVEAFETAAEDNANVQGIETDIRVSKDNKLVCVHDEELKIKDKDKNVTDTVKVKDANCSYLQNKFNVATFDEYIKKVKKSDKSAIIELKNETDSSTNKIDVAGGTKTIDRVIEKLKNENMLGRSMIIAFDYEALEYIRNDLKCNMELGYLVSNPGKEHIDKAAKLGVKNKKGELSKISIGLNQKNASPEIIEYAHKKGVKVNVYTADEYSRQSILNDMGVDIITTNVVESK